jgi:hypothetical protein
MRALIPLMALGAFTALPLVSAQEATPHKRTPQAPSSESSANPTPVASASAAASPGTTPKTTKPTRGTAAGGSGQVWVNTDTHVYHKEGSPAYGKTKHGKYLSEEQALKEGDRPAKHEKP